MTENLKVMQKELEVYYPLNKLEFDRNGRLLVFECRPETLQKARKFRRYTQIQCGVLHGL